MGSAILVTGATGTVGRATLDALHAAGAEPVAFVRDANRAACVLGGRTRLRVGDLAGEGSVRAALAGVDVGAVVFGARPRDA